MVRAAGGTSQEVESAGERTVRYRVVGPLEGARSWIRDRQRAREERGIKMILACDASVGVDGHGCSRACRVCRITYFPDALV